MRIIIFLVVSLLSVSTYGQAKDVCQIWNDYVSSKKNNTLPPLPDFSYAGYKFSEEALPIHDYPIFDVTKYGAIANDTLSDKEAIKKAIAAAEMNGKGIVFFPSGKYYINTHSDDNSIIYIQQSNIVLRGEEATLFFQRDLPPADPKKMWTCPYVIATSIKKDNSEITVVTGAASRESFEVNVADASQIKAGDWVMLSMENNSPEVLEYELQPRETSEKWKSILTKGVIVKEIHLVDKVEGNTITFYDPIHYDINPQHGWTINKYAHLENIGFEHLNFEGNWLIPFKHHGNAQHDGGWSILKMERVVNSWVRDCKFINVSRAVSIANSAASTALNNTIEGNLGHNAISITSASTGILNARTNDKAGQWHACGVGNGSITRNVIWRCKHTPSTSFESHASQPRCTLLDKMEGGFFLGRGGGALTNLPNHGRYLVLWNYKETDEGEKDFEFWSTKTWFWKVIPPIIVGFHGAGTTFKQSDLGYEESTGRAVEPESLFEAQLELRLGKLPAWVELETSKSTLD
ncbi:DUF4955 domain-containing protein [Labilibacter marinus]|uniref:DUF4955 domain-containing protein n=1 Tax=Labilibacter marinus TaxID=1477105 RepID=UPI00082A2F91|nr:DUF4955 domain-containing protein [Labilibacter marinus]